MAVTWKEVTTRKETHCSCCNVKIPKSAQCLAVSYWFVGNPKTDHYCVFCGPLAQAGKSFEEILEAKVHSDQAGNSFALEASV